MFHPARLWVSCVLLSALAFGPLTSPPVSAAEDDEAVRAAARARLEFARRALASVPDDAAGDACLAPYFFVRSDGERDGDGEALPLEAVAAEVDIAGVIAHVRLTQTYRNRGAAPLEAIYIFPASTRAAVHAMRMTVGDRVIEARIRKRAAAREEYEQARRDGRTASLLEQQRPNVFQMSVANILPGDEVRVELRYTELIEPEHGRYDFVLPAVVGPRYSKLKAAQAPRSERWVANPHLRAGERPPYDYRLRLRLRAGMPIAEAAVPSHPVEVDFTDAHTARLELDGGDGAGDRDLVLRYRLAGDAIQTGLLLHRGEQENHFLLMAQPPAVVERHQRVAREYLFVVDVSGSMGGFPLQTAKQLMKRLLGDLRSDDRFNVLLFAGGSAVLAEKPLPASRRNVRRARDWIEVMRGGGGTELLPALQRALAMPRAEGVSRTVVLISDGYVNVERKTFELVREKRGSANLFAFGIGRSVNRYLIEGLARAGLGRALIVLEPAAAAERAADFRRWIDSPVLQGLQLSFDGFAAYDVEPHGLPDLFAGQPVLIYGKWRGALEGRIGIRGRSAAGRSERIIDVAEAAAAGRGQGAVVDNPALPYLWARKRIRELDDLAQFGEDPDIEAEVTRLGLDYGLLTRFTSFVAVDSRKRSDGGRSRSVRQPLPMPAGVPDSAVGQTGVLGVMGAAPRAKGGYGVGLGGLGTVGRGAGGGGARRSMPMARAVVAGSLDTSVIRRTIRSKLRGVRRLYEKQLKAKPGLQGKVTLKLVIGARGQVAAASVVESTIEDEDFVKALLAAVRAWRFPAPRGGGKVVVTYPFIFRAAG